MKNGQKREWFFVEPLNDPSHKAVSQSDHLTNNPEKRIRRKDGVHRIFRCTSRDSACFIKNQFSESSFKLRFWSQVGARGPVRRCWLIREKGNGHFKEVLVSVAK